ncbi:maltokinase N-terminal cap-like domain-containing protein [Agrococcus sp. TSP3-2-1]|uniref:maltokinase N-terminal cap-like domain-containing protein n=1 Tax=Agrococcus sp. TSP3-2-1 TaxID=2804583 RepID=UPI003CEF983D
MSAPLPFDAPEVTEAIAAWMPSTRWYPLKGQHAEAALAHAFELGADAAILLMRAGDALLQVPVAWRDEPGSAPIAQLDDRWLVDACHDPDAVQAILDVASGTRAVTDLEGDTAGEPPAPAGASRVVSGEQSNTSIIGGDGTWIAKVFRVVHPGDNPDVVVTGALTRAGSKPVPALLAALRARWPAGDAFVTGHLLAVSQFVSGADDAWELYRQHALATLRGEQRQAPDARALGAAVATVHRDLAAALRTSAATDADTHSFISGLEQRLGWAREQAAGALADLDDELGRAKERLREIRSIGELQHIHGDLHLGQVLRSSTGDWLLLDFEGEPLRPMHERSIREPRLRDVVGMLRSFDYAAGSAQQELPGADPAIADAWVEQRQQEFLAGYADASGPVDEHDPVFRALLLDKALYEVVYEVRNRPDWLQVPLEAVRRLLRPSAR